jgi:hypothetical protein
VTSVHASVLVGLLSPTTSRIRILAVLSSSAALSTIAAAARGTTTTCCSSGPDTMSWKALDWATDIRVDSPTMRLILILLANKADEKFSRYPSVGTLVSESCEARSTVETLKRLEVEGFITRIAQYHESGALRSSRYLLNHAVAPHLKPGPDSGPLEPSSRTTIRTVTGDPVAIGARALATLWCGGHEALTSSRVRARFGMDCFEADAGTVTVTGKLVRATGHGLMRIDDTKSAAGKRTLPLPRFAADALVTRRRLPFFGEQAMIFPSSAGTWRDPNNFNKQWRQVRDQVGADGDTTHSFRKTVATVIDGGGLSA